MVAPRSKSEVLLEEYLATISPCVRRAVIEVSAACGDNFKDTGVGDWNTVWARRHPGARNLGARKVAALRGAVAFLKAKAEAESAAKAESKAAFEARLKALTDEKAAAEKRAKAADDAVKTTFTASQVKALATVMELCGLETVNLLDINAFFHAFGVETEGTNTKGAKS